MSYRLEWKQAKVERSGRTGWDVTNDLGYRVHVTRGWVVTRSMEFVPCNPLPPPALTSLRRSLHELIGVRPAFAGHSAIADPSAAKRTIVESLLRADTQAMGPIYPGAQKYCQAHYLIARADKEAIALPTEVDMVDQSIHVDGTFRRPGGSADEAFSVVSGLGNGKLIELPRGGDAAVALDTGRESATLVIRRSLDTLFDHIDFATMDDKRRGREMLQNLINDVEVELKVGS